MPISKTLILRGYPKSGVTDLTCEVRTYLGSAVIATGLAFTETAAGSCQYTTVMVAAVGELLATYSVNVFRAGSVIGGSIPVDLQELVGNYIIGGPQTGLEFAASILKNPTNLLRTDSAGAVSLASSAGPPPINPIIPG
jgi:hypothetical protein